MCPVYSVTDVPGLCQHDSEAPTVEHEDEDEDEDGNEDAHAHAHEHEDEDEDVDVHARTGAAPQL